MPKLKRGDVIRLNPGCHSATWFPAGTYLVKAYPSDMEEWREGSKFGPCSTLFVDIVNMDGTPPAFNGNAICACANLGDCVLDVFLTEARRAAQVPFPEPPVRVDRHGWNLNGPGYGRTNAIGI